MFRDVRSRVSFPELESRVLQFWRDEEIFKKSVANRSGGPEYVFYEGPPTANGRPGIHHVLARVFKDLFPRYKTMQGFYSERKGGWDTHGLPVELEVEKELGLANKKAIEDFGIEAFNARCRESVFRYVKQWEEMTDRIGFWVDTDQAYVTYDNGYIESEWWILKQFWDKGLIYRDYKVTPHCPRCGTSLSSHEVSLGYNETDDPSIYVRFKLLPGQFAVDGVPADNVSLLVWTTTPWTLPANVALAVNTSAEYAVVRRDDEVLVLAAARVPALLGDDAHVVAKIHGSSLLGLRYEPLFPSAGGDARPTEKMGEKPAWRVVAGDMAGAVAGDDEEGGKPFVSLDEGTGIVHMAPAYGAIDLEVGRAEGLPVLHTVDLKGAVVGVDPAFDGMFVKQADPVITRDLRDRGILFRADRLHHRYPFCWRCGTPLLYYAKTSWYIRTSALKDRLLANNQEINWYPATIKNGRFGNWLANNVDWAISRERYWGTPLPFWRCDSCDESVCVGSVADLSERAGRPLDGLDLHRPFVDEVTFGCVCGGTMRRVPELLDVWFDSGAMPVAQWHAPFENASVFEQRFPADYICEAIDQTRGWFYSLHAIATLLYDSPAYRNVICLGHILDGKGEKMSKSKGNVVNPWDVLDNQGADALRWYLYTASPPGNSRRFSAALVDESLRGFLLTLWNTYSFFVTYANLDGWTPEKRSEVRSDLDRWVLAELQRTVGDVTAALDAYDPTEAGRRIEAFVDNLSNWYVRRSRRRFWKSESDADKLAAYTTLYDCLVTLSTLIAPFVPFVAEEIYQNLVRAADDTAPISVHCADYPTADAALLDRALIDEVALVIRVVGLGRAARAKANLKVRQPLASITVRPRTGEEETTLRRLVDQIREELNVREVVVVHDAGDLFDYTVRPNLRVLGPRLGKGVGAVTAALKDLDTPAAVAAWRAGGTVRVADVDLGPDDVLVAAAERPGLVSAEEDGYVVGLATELTDDLIAEGQARELVHRIQTMRRTANFEIADRIETTYTGSPTLAAVLDRYADYVRAETLSRTLHEAAPQEGSTTETMTIDGETITVGVRVAIATG